MEAETPPRSGFTSFGCRLTGLAICDLPEHSHGINIKSLLKWSNFKWLTVICAFTHFKWIQSLLFSLVHLRPESYFLTFLNMVSKSRLIFAMYFNSPHSDRYNSQLCFSCTQIMEEKTQLHVLEQLCRIIR